MAPCCGGILLSCRAVSFGQRHCSRSPFTRHSGPSAAADSRSTCQGPRFRPSSAPQAGLSRHLNAILQPVRDHFENNAEAKELLKKVKSYKVTK
jgi:hypothetical protein